MTYASVIKAPKVSVGKCSSASKKAWKRGKFLREHLEYLESQFAAFLATSNGCKMEFFSHVWQEFFEKFPLEDTDNDNESNDDEEKEDADLLVEDSKLQKTQLNR